MLIIFTHSNNKPERHENDVISVFSVIIKRGEE